MTYKPEVGDIFIVDHNSPLKFKLIGLCEKHEYAPHCASLVYRFEIIDCSNPDAIGDVYRRYLHNMEKNCRIIKKGSIGEAIYL